MAAALFLVLADQHDMLTIACEQAAQHYRQQQRVFIYTQDQQQAEQIDELLWTREADSFIPHNLPGEGQFPGSPVEINWQAPNSRRQVLINLTGQVPAFVQQFNQVIDFVPVAEEEKQAARQRYRQYQSAGLTLATQPVST